MERFPDATVKETVHLVAPAGQVLLTDTGTVVVVLIVPE
jgi:hypothetical protein